MTRYDVHRSIEIDAAPQKVYETIADFGTWSTWSPWLCADPEAQVTVSDDAAAVGSIYAWTGELVGEGEIEHRQLHPGRSIRDELRFRKPFKSKSEVAFELEPAGDGTKVTWHMRGSLPWFLFWMRPQMETYIGMDYERGLRMLKEMIQTGQILSQTRICGVEAVGPLRMVGVRKECSASEIGPSMDAAFAETTQILAQHSIPSDGDAISVYHRFDLKARTFDYTSGFVVPELAEPLPNDLSSFSIPSTNALRVEHTGSYQNLGNAWSAAHQFARSKKLKPLSIGNFEVYKNSPKETAPADLITEIFLPVK